MFKSPIKKTEEKPRLSQQPAMRKFNSLTTPEEKKFASNNGRSQEWGISKNTPKASWKKNDANITGTATGRTSLNQKNNEINVSNKLREEEIEAKRALKSLEQKLTLLKSKVKINK